MKKCAGGLSGSLNSRKGLYKMVQATENERDRLNHCAGDKTFDSQEQTEAPKQSLWSVLFRGIKKPLKKIVPLRMFVIYCREISFGYRVYKRLLREYGAGTEFCMHHYPGTGDSYLAAGLLKCRLENKKSSGNYVVLLAGQAAKRVAELFDLAPVIVLSNRDMWKLGNFWRFLPPAHTHITNLHYLLGRDGYDIPFRMIGFRGTTFFEQYLIYAFADVRAEEFVLPTFSATSEKSDVLFAQHHLMPGKTVLIAPYANTDWPHFVPMDFWERLACRLQAEGYTVCTNSCGEKEPAILGTTAVQIPFSGLKCFLEKAGTFIGLRSGLCEVVSSIACKKIIIYPGGFYWPIFRKEEIATARDIFTMADLPGCRDCCMMEYDKDSNENVLIGEIVRTIRQHA